jgi:hypothetical protein
MAGVIGSIRRSSRSTSGPKKQSTRVSSGRNAFDANSFGRLFPIPRMNAGMMRAPGDPSAMRPTPARARSSLYGSLFLLRVPSGCRPMTVPGMASSSIDRCTLYSLKVARRRMLSLRRTGGNMRIPLIAALTSGPIGWS